jgi:hypothetical protein
MPQSNWRQCHKCYSLFYGGLGGSVCPAGGQHDYTGTPHNFSIDFVGDQTGGQVNWQWCRKCQGLFYAGASGQLQAWGPSTGTCPAGGGHRYDGSAGYRLHFEPTGGESGWTYCNKCQGLFFAGTPDLTSGTCPAGGGHNYSGSGNYGLTTV